MPTTCIHDVELAALDFETTGLDPDLGDRVIEFSVVRGRAGSAPRVTTALVDPGRPVASSDVHGITDDMLRDAPRFAQIAGILRDALDGAVLVAHHAAFDVAFLHKEFALAGLPCPEPPVIDSLALARRLLPLTSHSLANLCAHLGIERARAHRAEDDARATWQAAWMLLEMADPNHLLTLEDAVALGTRKERIDTRGVAAALREAALAGRPVDIEYRGHARPGGLLTTRTIVVRRVNHRKVQAFCQLRNEERVFRLDRIRLV